MNAPSVTKLSRTTQLGELVVAVFDEAACYSTNPREVSHLAISALMRIVRRALAINPPPQTPWPDEPTADQLMDESLRG